MKKLILLLSILILGCQTNTQQNNNKWTFDATDGSYIQWNGDDANANEMLHNAMKQMSVSYTHLTLPTILLV